MVYDPNYAPRDEAVTADVDREAEQPEAETPFSATVRKLLAHSALGVPSQVDGSTPTDPGDTGDDTGEEVTLLSPEARRKRVADRLGRMTLSVLKDQEE